MREMPPWARRICRGDYHGQVMISTMRIIAAFLLLWTVLIGPGTGAPAGPSGCGHHLAASAHDAGHGHAGASERTSGLARCCLADCLPLAEAVEMAMVVPAGKNLPPRAADMRAEARKIPPDVPPPRA
jgi:hypothetical protein